MDIAPRSDALEVPAGNEPAAPRKPFNLLRWYAWVSLAIILSVAAGLGLISSRFIIDESVERDALLTAQFITSIADAEVRHVSIPNVRTMGEPDRPAHRPQQFARRRPGCPAQSARRVP